MRYTSKHVLRKLGQYVHILCQSVSNFNGVMLITGFTSPRHNQANRLAAVMEESHTQCSWNPERCIHTQLINIHWFVSRNASQCFCRYALSLGKSFDQNKYIYLSVISSLNLIWHHVAHVHKAFFPPTRVKANLMDLLAYPDILTLWFHWEPFCNVACCTILFCPPTQHHTPPETLWPFIFINLLRICQVWPFSFIFVHHWRLSYKVRGLKVKHDLESEQGYFLKKNWPCCLSKIDWGHF